MIKFFIDYAFTHLKALDRKTLLYIILFIPVLVAFYIKYVEFSNNMNQINQNLLVIQSEIQQHQKDHVVISSMQSRKNEELKQYIDVSITSIKKEIIEDVGNQLKYQLIYQNKISRKAIIDQLELWIKSNKKNTNNENFTNYQVSVDSAYCGI